MIQKFTYFTAVFGLVPLTCCSVTSDFAGWELQLSHLCLRTRIIQDVSVDDGHGLAKEVTNCIDSCYLCNYNPSWILFIYNL